MVTVVTHLYSAAVVAAPPSQLPRRFRRLIPAIAALTVALALPAAAQAVPQTWVSGVGDDANPCSRTAPCRTFAGAISKTDTGGIISVLDPGGFGAVTITKAITIDANGVFGGVLVQGTNGIVVTAPAGSNVVLRGLTIQSIGANCSSPSALHGIRFLSGGALHVENVNINGFPGAAIDAEPTIDGTSITVINSELRDNCGQGLLARRSGGHLDATLSGGFLSNDGTAVIAGAGSDVRITQNTIVSNAVGLGTEAGATLESFGDNRIAGNIVDGAPTVELNAPPPGPSPGAPTPPPTPPPTSTPPAPLCHVPTLTSLTLADAATALTKAHCSLGTVHFHLKRHKTSIKRNHVYAQSPKAGTTVRLNAKVDVTINGKKPSRRSGHKRRARAAFGFATRTWVSGVGDDANPCSRTAPCKTFAGALLNTADHGIIDVLDPGEFGPVTINQSLTIDAAGNSASILAAPGSPGIVVNPGADKNVILRGITVINSPGCSASGAGDGVSMLSGNQMHLENVSARGFAGAGVNLHPSANAAVTIHGGQITDNCTDGVTAQRPGGHVDVTVQGTTLSNDNTGLFAGDGSLIRSSLNTITGNSIGRAKTAAGVLQSWGDDHVAGNTSNGVAPAPLFFF
jgi:nitrous oxidase accessory protein NosD